LVVTQDSSSFPDREESFPKSNPIPLLSVSTHFLLFCPQWVLWR
jgi:hypothetical protein